jgi:hypothetical protein
VLDNFFTVSSEWALMTWVVERVPEVVRRWRRDRFFFLDALVQERLTNVCTGWTEADFVVDLPDGKGLLPTPLHTLFRGNLDLAMLTKGCTPDTIHQRLVDALKEQLKHYTTGSQIIASARAATLSCTVRIRWCYEPKRRKHMQSELLLEFQQYALVSEHELQRLSAPPFEEPSPKAYPSWEAWQDAVRAAWQAWDAAYGHAARQAQEVQRRLTTPLKTCHVKVWLDHARVPERLHEYWKNYRDVWKRRLARGDATRHEKWVYAQLPGDDITMLILLYLCQERMLELPAEGAQFLQRYFRKFRGITIVGWQDLFVHMQQHFVLPEDWRTVRPYIREVLRGKCATEVRKAAETGREQSVASLEVVEAQQEKKKQGYVSKAQRPCVLSSDGHPSQVYSVDEVVRCLQEDTKDNQWAPSRSTVYNWITKGHRWYGKIDVIHAFRGQPRITEHGLAQVRMIVQVENRCDRLRNSPGMTADNLKKLYQRYKKFDGTPDLDAIEGHIARRNGIANAGTSANARFSLKERCTALENPIADLEDRLSEPMICNESETMQEELEKARDHLRQIQERSGY